MPKSSPGAERPAGTALDASLMVLGAGGMLGGAVAEAASAQGWHCLALRREEADLRDTAAIEGLVRERRPAVVVNCAAFTDVDGCETKAELAEEVNGHAVGRLGRALAKTSTRLLHVSTDYVFDGRGSRPYVETEATSPASAYGRSKLLGELALAESAATVVRTSWLFGPGGKNFAKTIAAVALRGDDLRVVADQHGCPTYAPFLANALVELAAMAHSGSHLPSVLHYCNGPPTTWHGFACEIVKVVGAEVEVAPVSTDEFPRPAKRPEYSVLSVSRIEEQLGATLPSWREGLLAYWESGLLVSEGGG